MIKQMFMFLNFVVWLSIATQVNANTEPHQVIASTTDQVLALLKTGIDPVKQPDRFIASLSEVLDPVVAFNYIAKGVMGQYSKTASPEQKQRFIASFKKGLVSQYGGYISISGIDSLKVTTLPPEQPVGAKRKESVKQKIISGSGGVTKIAYTMGKNSQGQWKVLNIIIDGINLGQTLRGQFSAAVEKNKGDLDKTIVEWEKGIQ